MVNIYRGDSPAAAQVTSWTFGGTWEADDLVVVTINGKTLSMAAGSTVIATIIDSLVTAYNNSTIPEFTRMTASRSVSTFKLTADNAGEPFTAALSTTEANGSAADAQTIGSATAVTASKGPYHYDDPANWSLGAIPVNSDDVVFNASSGSAKYGLDQNGVTLASLTFSNGWKGTIGLPDNFGTGTSGFSEYRDRFLKTKATNVQVDCDSGQVRLNLHTGASTVDVLKTGTPTADGSYALDLLGVNAANALNAMGGSVGLAVGAGSVSTFPTVRVANDADVLLGSGSTLTDVEVAGGTLEVAAATATIRMTDGSLELSGGAHPDVVVNGGTVAVGEAGDFGDVTVTDQAKFDLSPDIRVKTFTAKLKLYKGATFLAPFGADLDQGFQTVGCGIADVTVDFGRDKDYTVTV